jgi:hypothetical protein
MFPLPITASCCREVQAALVLPVGYVVSARRIADRRMILAGYRLADLLGGLWAIRFSRSFGSSSAFPQTYLHKGFLGLS